MFCQTYRIQSSFSPNWSCIFTVSNQKLEFRILKWLCSCLSLFFSVHSCHRCKAVITQVKTHACRQIRGAEIRAREENLTMLCRKSFFYTFSLMSQRGTAEQAAAQRDDQLMKGLRRTICHLYLDSYRPLINALFSFYCALLC